MLSDFEKEVIKMHYEPVTHVENIFNKVEGLIKHRDMANFPYSQPQVISKAYTVINTTVNLREFIKSWKHLPPI